MSFGLDRLFPQLMQLQDVYQSNLLSLEDLFQKEEPTLMQRYEAKLGDISGLSQKEIAKRKREIQKQYKTEKQKRVLNQFLRNMLSSATLGLSKKTALKPFPPEGAGEQVAAGMGHFAGFLQTPIQIGKMAGVGMAKLVGKFMGQKAPGFTRLAKYAVTTPTTLATASVVEDITDIEKTPERAIGGATIGVIFGGTSLVHIGKSKLLSQIARQTGGRALMKAAGMYRSEEWTKENIPNLVFGEMLNTYFLSHGIRATDIVAGKLDQAQWKKVEKVQGEIDTVNEKIPRPYKDVMPEKIPDVIKIVSKLTGSKLTDDAINLVREAKHFKYNAKTKEKSIVPPIEDKPLPKPDELLFRQEKPDTFILDSFGKEVGKLPEKDFNAKVKEGLKFINKVRKFPTQRIDKSMQEYVIKKLMQRKDLVFHDTETFYNFFREIPKTSAGKQTPRWIDMQRVDHILNVIENAPKGQAPEVLGNMFLEYYGYRTYDALKEGKWENSELQKLYNQEKNWQNKVRHDKVTGIRGKIESGKLGGSPLIHLMRLKIPGQLADVRLALQHKETMTGLPWAIAGDRVTRNARIVQREHVELTRELKAFGKTTPEEHRIVEEYYTTRFDAYGKYRANKISETELNNTYLKAKNKLSPRLQDWVDIINKLEATLSPRIQKYRFKAWMKSYEDVQAGRRKKTLPIFKNQKKIEPSLKKIAEKYYEQGFDVDPKKVIRIQEEWLDRELVKHAFGKIEEGNYIPGVFTGRWKAGLTTRDYVEFIDFLGTGHTKSRGHPEGIDLEAMLIDEFLKAPLPIRIDTHVKQLLNLEHLKQPLRMLDDLIGITKVHMRKTYAPKIGGVGADPKAHKFFDLMKFFANRAKGYPVKVPLHGRVLKIVQSAFFRALVVKPFLWLRNLFQGVVGVTVPDKRIMNPRWHGGMNTKQRFMKFPADVREEFDVHVNQFAVFEKHYLWLEETEKLKKIPYVGGFFRFAERVGKVYAFTDYLNRRSVFTRTFNRTRYFVNQFKAGRINADTLYKKLAISKLDPNERLRFMELIDQGNAEKIATFHGKWMSDNSQWMYGRGEKSLWEMTGGGEAFSNLFTWTKGIAQQNINVGLRFKEGMERGDPKIWQPAATQLIGLALVASAANTALKNVGNKHGSRYNDYSYDMFFWEFGGVSLDIVKGFGDMVANLVTSFDGTPDEQSAAIRGSIKFLDNQGIRQLIPFAKQTFALIESVTGRSYISPLYNWITKKGYDKVDRTVLEKLSHAMFATDPTKSQRVYTHVTTQYEKFKEYYAREENPAKKAYYYTQYKRFEHLSNLLDRFTPLQIQKYMELEELKRWQHEQTEESYFEELARDRREAKLDERKSREYK